MLFPVKKYRNILNNAINKIGSYLPMQPDVLQMQLDLQCYVDVNLILKIAVPNASRFLNRNNIHMRVHFNNDYFNCFFIYSVVSLLWLNVKE